MQNQLFMIVSMIDELSIYSDTTNLYFADTIYVFFTQNLGAIGVFFFLIITFSTWSVRVRFGKYSQERTLAHRFAPKDLF